MKTIRCDMCENIVEAAHGYSVCVSFDDPIRVERLRYEHRMIADYDFCGDCYKKITDFIKFRREEKEALQKFECNRHIKNSTDAVIKMVELFGGCDDDT